MGVDRVVDRVSDTGVHQHVEVPRLEVLDHLVREDDVRGELLDVDDRLAELRAGRGLLRTLPYGACGRLTEPDRVLGLACRGPSAVTGELDRARLLEDSIRENFTLLGREQIAASGVDSACERDSVGHSLLTPFPHPGAAGSGA